MTKKTNRTGIIPTGRGDLASRATKPRVPSSLASRSAEVDLAAKRASIEVDLAAKKAAIEVITEALRTGLAVFKLREATRAQWEATEQWLAQHDAESGQELRRLEKLLSSQEEDTTQLRLLLDFYDKLDPDKAPMIAESVGEAIRLITARQR